MSIPITVVENGLIGSNRDFSQSVPGVLVVPEAVFRALRQVAFDPDEECQLLTFFVQKGREYIRVRNYVGLMTLPDGTQIEILPKVGPQGNPRSVLLSMLRHLRHSPFRTLTTARTSHTKLPLWDVFVLAFLEATESLLGQGMQQAYVSVEQNERFWKGKFQAARQQRENAYHPERLAMVHDTLTADVPPNRILKATLLYLLTQTVNDAARQRIRQLVGVMEQVPPSETLSVDLWSLNRANRLFARYQTALRWAEALLGNQAFGVKSGRVTDLSLLFPMERVFEDYVAYGIRTYWPETGAVTVQESSAHLVDEHAGTPKFKLRPDMLIRHNDRIFVLDTKWKFINGQESGTGSYGIEQADLYQLYAYGKKYAASDLFLIYPANETFHKPLAIFGYDAETRLHVVPFDVTVSLTQEVEKLAAYSLSFR